LNGVPWPAAMFSPPAAAPNFVMRALHAVAPLELHDDANDPFDEPG